MSNRIASFFATYTTSINEVPSTKDNEEIHQILIDEVGANEHLGIYNWDFTYLDDQFLAIVNEIASASIIKIQISFKYNNNQDGLKLSVFKYDAADPKNISAANVIAGISATELATADLVSTNQTGVTVTLADSDNFYYETLLDIAARESITVAIRRHSDFDTSDGSVELSGQTLVGGTSEWREAAVTEPSGAPLLIITYDVPEESHPVLNMKYTTADPTTNQNTPINSIGKYVAPNDVYPSANIASSINSTQTTVPIETSASLPTVLGLASVGPEVFKYTNIDTTNHQLAGATRGIAPLSSFPAGFDSFKNPEKVYYLNDINLLFDTRPSSGLSQYRCVAIMNSDTDDDFSITGAVIGIAQDSLANVQIRIGVEVPRFDSRAGLSKSGTLPALLIDTDFSDANGFFDGAAIKFLSPVEYAIVDSYTSDGQFILDRSVAGLATGRNFVILPAPAQQIGNDATAPTGNSGRFSGFSEDIEGVTVALAEHGTTMQENDLFYVWIRRTLAVNVAATNDTGAVLVFRYRDI